MRFAKDVNGNRICADNAVKGEECTCLTCGKPLILKRGKVMLPHFAHFPNSGCVDTWQYEYSAWQQEWQNKFPPENQEVIVSHSGQTHRADILIDDTVLLFQETAISPKFFQEKTKYFQQAAKDVIWVINAKEDIEAGILRANRKDRNGMFWDHPPYSLQEVDIKKDKHIHILLDMGEKGVRKVEWIAPNSGFERFIIDATFSPDLTTAEGRKEFKMNQYGRFDAFKAKNMPWKRKISSMNGSPDKRWHTCEKDGGYHLNKCRKCPHNLINEYRSARGGTPGGLYFYCRYPEVAQPVVAGDGEGQQRAEVPSIWLK